jgi:hypothetical protein
VTRPPLRSIRLSASNRTPAFEISEPEGAMLIRLEGKKELARSTKALSTLSASWPRMLTAMHLKDGGANASCRENSRLVVGFRERQASV